MIKRIIILAMAIAACIWIGMYIQSYNANNTLDAQQRFKEIMNTADDKAQELLQGADEQKKKAIQFMKDKRDNLLQKQQKELFNQN